MTVIPLAKLKPTVGGTSVGNMMEWYDFGIFAFLVPTISEVFFAGGTSSGSLVATFTMFAAAFVVRPLGGLFFGPLGDRIGRKRVLAATMITMAIGTLAIGLLPGQAIIGAWAPVLLLLARLVQGFSTGGEYAGAMTYLGEHAPDTRRGYISSWLEFGTLSGYVLGAAVATGVTLMFPPDVLVSWGWRIPFLIAGPLGLIGLYIRMRLEESPAFERQAGEQNDADQPSQGQRREQSDGSANQPDQRGDTQQRPDEQNLGEQLRNTVIRPWRALLICIGLVLVFNVTNYTLTQYMPTYLSEEVGLPRTPALAVVLAVMVILLGLVTNVGRLSDRIGRLPILYVGCALLLVVSLPAFLLASQGAYGTAFLGCLVLGLALLCFNSTLPATLPALFAVAVRYGSLAIAFNFSVAVFGGTTPLIASALVAGTGSPLAPTVLLVVAGVIGAVAVYFTRETARRPMPGSQPSAATQQEAQQVAAEQREREVDPTSQSEQ